MSLAEALGIAATATDEVIAAARFLGVSVPQGEGPISERTVHSILSVLRQLPHRWSFDLCKACVDKGAPFGSGVEMPREITVSLVAVLLQGAELREGSTAQISSAELSSPIGIRCWHGEIWKEDFEVFRVISKGESVMNGDDDHTVRLSVHVGDLKLGLEEYLELEEGSELAFSLPGGLSVEIVAGKLPVASAKLHHENGVFVLTVGSVYGKKRFSRRKHFDGVSENSI